MSEGRLTPREWADMNATAMAEKNHEVFDALLSRLDESTARREKENETRHWRRAFAAAAIGDGKTCDEAMAIADEMVLRMCSD